MTTSYHFPVLSVILFASFFLTACGGSEQDGAVSQDKNASNHTAAVKPKEGAKASASTAEKTRKCPAQPATGMRPDGVPVDDIVGIRPGMHIDDVLWVLECRDDVPLVEVGEKWNIKQTHGFPLRQLIRASDGTPCSGQEIVRDMGGYGTSKQCNDAGYQLQAVKAISQEFEVVFTGMPGDELAGAVWRRNVFAEGENPTIEALTQSLSGKYGAPHVTEKDRQGRTLLSWQYDLLNRPMSQSAKNFNSCRSYINAVFGQSHAWSSACGLTINVQIAPVYGNDLLAREMHMVVMDQKNFYDRGKQFEQDLLAAFEQRKREEAAAATQDAVGPDL